MQFFVESPMSTAIDDYSDVRSLATRLARDGHTQPILRNVEGNLHGLSRSRLRKLPEVVLIRPEVCLHDHGLYIEFDRDCIHKFLCCDGGPVSLTIVETDPVSAYAEAMKYLDQYRKPQDIIASMMI